MQLNSGKQFCRVKILFKHLNFWKQRNNLIEYKYKLNKSTDLYFNGNNGKLQGVAAQWGHWWFNVLNNFFGKNMKWQTWKIYSFTDSCQYYIILNSLSCKTIIFECYCCSGLWFTAAIFIKKKTFFLFPDVYRCSGRLQWDNICLWSNFLRQNTHNGGKIRCELLLLM